MKEINIAEILKNKPRGTKLYSPIFGECTFSFIQGVTDAICVIANDNREFFDYKGLYSPTGKCLLFPSRYMHDWSKFTWKRGDVLVNGCGFQCIFKEWASDDYTMFNGCYSNSRDGYEDVTNAETAKFDKLDNNIAYGYIRKIERKLGGILNLTTLEIEMKSKCEFKPFDRCIYKIRNCEGSIWQASFVSYVDEYGATPMGISIDEDLVNLIILPYNDQTKLLVGTTDEWKGGEQWVY